jgi:hypothetical protein
MNKSYSILKKHVNKGEVFIEQYQAPDILEEKYQSGSSLAFIKEPIQLFYQFKTNNKTDYISGIHLFPVISQRFKEVLFKLDVDYLEFLPVHLICEKTKEVDSFYSLLNILNNISCLDREKSEYETVPDFEDIIFGLTHLVIREENLQGRGLARMQEIPSVILVSSQLRKFIEEEALAGVKFQSLEDYQLI